MQMRKEGFIPNVLPKRQWYVVYSKPRREEFAQFHLKQKGLEVFFPRLQLPHPSMKQGSIVPLFPNYLFVQLQLPEEYYYVLWAPGVKSLVCFNGTPAPIDERIVMLLKEQASTDGVLNGRLNLTVGQEIRITGGPFDGLVGIIQDPPDARGRISLLMKLLSRQIKVEVPLRFVKSDWIISSKDREHQTIAPTS